MNKTIEKIMLLVILVLAFVLRVFQLSKVPPSLNWDEVSLGYNAYSISETGKDEWGNTLPIIFTAYGDYKLPGYIYTLVPLIKIFGPIDFAVRLPSVVAGIITVFLTFLITKELFSEKFKSYWETLLPLTASFLVAIEPWSLFLSRPAFEANLALCFFMAGFYFFLLFFNSKFYLLHSIFFFGLSVWTYNSYRVFTPLFIVLLVIIYRKRLANVFKNKVLIVFCLSLISLLFIPMFYQLTSGVGRIRYDKVAIINTASVGRIVELREKYNFNPTIERLIFNRPTYFAASFTKNVFSHFSYNFLFQKGGSNYQFNVPEIGILYKINILFLIIGLLQVLKLRGSTMIVILGWLFLGTFPSALTNESPHVLRSITMLSVPMILSALGAVSIAKYIADKNNKLFGIKAEILFLILFFLSIIYSLTSYFNKYMVSYRKDYSWSWQYGYKEAVNYVRVNFDRYDKIFFTKKYGEPHEFVLFYMKWNPEKYYSDGNLIRFKQSEWFWVDRFDKFYFVNDWDVPKEEWQPFVLESRKEVVDCRGYKCLLITSPDNVPKTWTKLETINFLDGKPAFEIYDNK